MLQLIGRTIEPQKKTIHILSETESAILDLSNTL